MALESFQNRGCSSPLKDQSPNLLEPISNISSCLFPAKRGRNDSGYTPKKYKAEAILEPYCKIPHPSEGHDVQQCVAGLKEVEMIDQNEAIFLKVRLLNGTEGVVPVLRQDNLLVVKEKLEASTGIQIHQQRLIHNGVIIADEKTVQDYSLRTGSVLHLVLALRGGYL